MVAMAVPLQVKPFFSNLMHNHPCVGYTRTSKGKKTFKKVDVGMTKNSVQKNQETRKEIVKRVIYYHPYIKPRNCCS